MMGFRHAPTYRLTLQRYNWSGAGQPTASFHTPFWRQASRRCPLRVSAVRKADVGRRDDYFVGVLRADATCPEAADSSAADLATDDAVFTTQRSSSRASGPKTPTEPATPPP